MNKTQRRQCILYGAMIGDAMGVPFEFKEPHEIREEFLDDPCSITEGYSTYPKHNGKWSDDFSQMLCVLDNVKDGWYDDNFYEDMLEWRKGKYWIDNQVFDIGIQTAKTLHYFQVYGCFWKCSEYENGNGSLMRVAPTAFIEDYSYSMQAVLECSWLTHNHDLSIKICKMYVTLLSLIMNGWSYSAAINRVEYDFKWVDDEDVKLGTGYVVSSWQTMKYCINESNSFKDTIKNAIRLGGDTDTNASITGAVAGLIWGVEIPETWKRFLQPSFNSPWLSILDDV